MSDFECRIANNGEYWRIFSGTKYEIIERSNPLNKNFDVYIRKPIDEYLGTYTSLDLTEKSCDIAFALANAWAGVHNQIMFKMADNNQYKIEREILIDMFKMYQLNELDFEYHEYLNNFRKAQKENK